MPRGECLAASARCRDAKSARASTATRPTAELASPPPAAQPACAAPCAGAQFVSLRGEAAKPAPLRYAKRRETTTVENEKRHSCTRGGVLAPRRKRLWFAYGWLSLLWLELRLPSDNFLSVETLHFKGECILLGRVHKDDSTHKHRTWIRNFDMVSRAKNTSHTV